MLSQTLGPTHPRVLAARGDSVLVHIGATARPSLLGCSYHERAPDFGGTRSCASGDWRTARTRSLRCGCTPIASEEGPPGRPRTCRPAGAHACEHNPMSESPVSKGRTSARAGIDGPRGRGSFDLSARVRPPHSMSKEWLGDRSESALSWRSEGTGGANKGRSWGQRVRGRPEGRPFESKSTQILDLGGGNFGQRF